MLWAQWAQTRRELDGDAMRGAVIVDSREAAARRNPATFCWPKPKFMRSSAKYWRAPRPYPSAEITVFKSLGIAVEDLAAAKLVLEARRNYSPVKFRREPPSTRP